jgi:hypothetical protein
VLELRDVWLRIPVNTRETRTLKKALIRSLTGGALRNTRAGAEIEALRGITCTIQHGERVALIGHPAAPSAGRGVLNRIAALLSGLTPGLSSEPPANGQGQPPLPRFAKLVMVGDFLDPLDEIQRCVAGYAANGVGGALVPRPTR